MRIWKRVAAGVMTAALVAGSLGIVSFADETAQKAGVMKMEAGIITNPMVLQKGVTS